MIIQSDTLILIRSSNFIKCNFKRFHNYGHEKKKIISSLFKAQNCTVVAISCKAAFFNYLLRFFYFDLNFAIIFAFLTYFLHNFDLVSIKQLSEATTINFDQFFDQFAKLCAIALQKRLSS